MSCDIMDSNKGMTSGEEYWPPFVIYGGVGLASVPYKSSFLCNLFPVVGRVRASLSRFPWLTTEDIATYPQDATS